MSQSITPNNASEKNCRACSKTFVEEMPSCPDCGGPLAAPDPLVGTIFAEKYEIQGVLGSGGMSIVYKARHKYMNRIVAVKLLLEHLADDPTAFQRFQKEAQAASSLSHQNIVGVYDFGVSGQQAYFVMDCLEGDSLQDIILRDDGMTMSRAVDVFRQTCDGLSHAHKKGIVHRDLKPSNIVLVKEEDGSETVKIVDFGLAKVHRPEGVEEARLTQSGMVFGSPLYMSPEQCQGYPLDARSDIYSMGVLMYETLAGTLPFQSDSFFNIALLHIHEAPPPFTKSAPNKFVPTELQSVIFKCLEKDADRRYQNVEELRQSILDAALKGGVPGLVSGAVPVKESGKQSPFRQTFENMRAVLANSGGSQAIKKTSLPRVIVGSLVAMTICVTTGYFFFFPGVEGDRGTPFDKVRWQFDLEGASRAMAAGDFPKANDLLADAKTIAARFGDRHSRLRLTLERQSEMYAGWNKFPEAERANQEAVRYLTEQIIAEADEIKQLFLGFGEPTDSESEKQRDKLHAAADSLRLISSAKRLHSRNLFAQEEALLNDGMEALKRLQMGDIAQVAEMETLKADCLIAQQRLDEVRKLLVDARDIRRKHLSDDSKQSKRHYLKAELRLGQFDRDQSNYADAQKELQLALDMAKKDFPDEKNLLAECMNSYGDFLRQTGKKAEAAEMIKQAKELHTSGGADDD